MATIDKTAINVEFQRLYDEGMAAGKHGHYETMFAAMHQAYTPHITPHGIGVKGLVWESVESTSEFAAVPEFWMCYRIALRTDGMKTLRLEWRDNRNDDLGQFLHWDQAKVAAQTDLDRRLSALQRNPEGAVEPVAWLWAHANDPFYWNLQKAEPATSDRIIKKPLYLHPPSRGLTIDEASTLAKDTGADFVLDALAGALKVKSWVQKDGSETWDGDVHATLMGILYGAGVIDPETNEPLYLGPLVEAARRYMKAVKRLGEDSGYNRLSFFEAPISKMPNDELGMEAVSRWQELNDAGVALTKATNGWIE